MSFEKGDRPASSGVGRSKYETVERICYYIRSNSEDEITLEKLEGRFGISRFAIQKSFKEVMGISPRKYLEECRIQKLKGNLRSGDPMPEAVYKTGYRSQSWLYENASSKLGMLPSDYRKGGKGARIEYLTSPCRLGFLLVAQTSHGICSVSLGDSEEDLVGWLKEEYPEADISKSENVRKRVQAILDYFDGQLLNLPVGVGGTEFQRRVWAAITTIPYGETRTYRQLAEMVGKPDAYRAVANACGANPVPLIVPCHRVVRKDGGLGGYALGIERKKYLLEMEKRNAGEGKVE